MSRKAFRSFALRSAVVVAVAPLVVACGTSKLKAADVAHADAASSAPSSASSAASGASAASATPASTSAAAPSAASDLAHVTLRVGDQKGGSQSLLDAAGLLSNLPYKITFSDFTSGPPLLEAINAGSIDVGAVGDTPPVFAAAAGSRIVIVGATESTPAGLAIVVPAHSPVTSIDQLKGKTVALAQGSAANYELLVVLKKAGLSFSDIKPAYLQPADALSAFTAGRVDAWAIWDPYTALAQKSAGARILVAGTGYVSGLGFQVAAPNALTDPAKTAAIRDYLSRLAQAHQWSVQHQDAWAATWAGVTGLAPDIAKTTVERGIAHSTPITQSVIASEQAEADAFKAAGLIPASPDIAKFVDTRFNATAGSVAASPTS